MDAEINNVIYMELHSGPKIANSTCGKTIDVKTIDRDSTVFITSDATTYIQNLEVSILTHLVLRFRLQLTCSVTMRKPDVT